MIFEEKWKLLIQDLCVLVDSLLVFLRVGEIPNIKENAEQGHRLEIPRLVDVVLHYLGGLFGVAHYDEGLELVLVFDGILNSIIQYIRKRNPL